MRKLEVGDKFIDGSAPELGVGTVTALSERSGKPYYEVKWSSSPSGRGGRFVDTKRPLRELTPLEELL